MIKEKERRLHELKSWEMRTLQMREKTTQLDLDCRRAKQIGEPYIEITGIAHVKTNRHKRA